MDKNAFYRALKQDCLDCHFEEIRPKAKDGKRLCYLLLPELETAQEKFNQLQGFKYSYVEEEEEDWESGDESSDESSDEE